MSWEQALPDETPKAWAAFCSYRDLPPEERGVDQAYRDQCAQSAELKGTGGRKKGTRRAPRHWWNWARRFDWLERAQEYDKHRAESRREKVKELEQEAAVDWFEKRQKLLEEIWDAEVLAVQRAKTILSLPVIETEVKDTKDGKVKVVMPVRGATLTAAVNALVRAEEVTSTIVAEQTGESGDVEGGIWTVAPDPEGEDE
jgi:hypothetical protein